MTAPDHPSYLSLPTEELHRRARSAESNMENCSLCARVCEVNRLDGELGVCKTGENARVSSWGPHLGEEAPLRGRRGSGTIFFARCNLRCQFCQNSDISQSDSGREVTPQMLANIMLELQLMGCHNINLVSPSHVVPHFLAALPLAVEGGLRIPLVYNTGGYDCLETLELLDGIIDIYMPDMKYAEGENARKYSRVEDYPKVNQAAVKEMHRQVGDLQIDQNGIALRGLLIRHLVMPRDIAGTKQVFQFLSEEISKNTYLNIMAQYHPAYRSSRYPEIDRRITPKEYNQAIQMATEADLTRLDQKAVLLF